MNYRDYICPELLVLVPFMVIIDMALRRSKIPDSVRFLLVGLISVFMSALWVFATSCLDGIRCISIAVFTSVTQGVLIAGASIYAESLIDKK